jgi:methylmalonyl-CoA mutase
MYEQLRLRTERHVARGGKNPRVLLAEAGDAKMRAARSNFASNIFACAGFDLVAKRFSSAERIVASDADLIVLCSSDAEYLMLAIDVIARLKALGRKTPVIVAGNPDSIEQLQVAGVADFVHLRSKPIEFLAKWQQRLGIKD